MPVEIDHSKCDGCGICVDTCPGDVLNVNPQTGKAQPKYPEDCWYCGACSVDCPKKAVKVIFPYLIR
jgi:NAD-dependent dihydropyrimidine dehydrogenase PreA subunit